MTEASSNNPYYEFQEAASRLKRFRRGSLLAEDPQEYCQRVQLSARIEEHLDFQADMETETSTVVGESDEEDVVERNTTLSRSRLETAITGKRVKSPYQDALNSSKSVIMAVKTHTWISLWFLITAPVIFWDASYVFMRPRSMVGGDLHWIWKPYEIYQNVDLIYGIPALEEGDGFPNAQSLLNIIETVLNIAYLYYAHIAAWPPATLIGFTSAALTLAKTVLYWAQEYYCNYCATGQNSTSDLILYWIIPNGFWIVVPTVIVYQLGKDLVEQLNLAAKVQATNKAK